MEEKNIDEIRVVNEITAEPVVLPDVERAARAMKLFEELKRKILTPSDMVRIGDNLYVKRSGWRKIALAFNVRTEILSVERKREDGVLTVWVTARATAPNGRSSDQVAVCDSTEFSGNLKPTQHNIETKAATRAVNRAVSDLVGGGEVSAEEMTSEEPDPLLTPKQESLLHKLVDDGKINLTHEEVKTLTKQQASGVISRFYGDRQ